MTQPAASPILEVTGLSKSYAGTGGAPPTDVIAGIDLAVAAGQTVAIVGPSGCGKTTLLNLLGTLDTPTAGEIRINQHSTASLDDKQRAQIRARQIGFVFQEHHLLPQCSAIENTLIPTLAKGVQNTDAQQRAEALLTSVGLGDRMTYRPDALSGGQRQRVAIVRALINRPALLLVDEPTGALDAQSAEQIMDLLLEMNRKEQTAMVLVTHAPNLAARMDRVYRMQAGKLVQEAGA